MSLQLDLSNWQSGQILCLVSRPDSVVIEVEVDKNAIGQEILDKVCASIGTVEKDYFGLQYYGPKREPLWLNLRNRVIGKVSGQAPLRLRLRVKYFVETHFLQQESTRRIFYLQLKQDLIDGKLKVSSDLLIHTLAIIAQAELGDISASGNISCTYEAYTNLFPTEEYQLTQRELHSVWEQHVLLHGLNKAQAYSKFLSVVSNWPTYGTETYQLKLETSSSSGKGSSSPVLHRQQPVNITFTIGPQGVELLKENEEEPLRIPFQAVQLATHTGKLIDVHVYQDDGTIKTLVLRANTESQSNALYRMITEMLAFYTWDTVHSSVIHQHSLDFKGHFFALFKPNVSDTDKHYIFDVQRTCREAYDNARRILYRKQVKMQAEPHGGSTETSTCGRPAKEVTGEGHRAEIQQLQERLQQIGEALTCQVCFDLEIDVAFIPCGHQVCCKACAERCQICPVCRKEVSNQLKVFLPISRDIVSDGCLEPAGSASPVHDSNSSTSFLAESKPLYGNGTNMTRMVAV